VEEGVVVLRVVTATAAATRLMTIKAPEGGWARG